MFYFEGGEVPATKLAALQKVLQSEFLNAVREVYEHVYETVDVQGNPEIRASATAKVPIDLSTNPYRLLCELSTPSKSDLNNEIVHDLEIVIGNRGRFCCQ